MKVYDRIAGNTRRDWARSEITGKSKGKGIPITGHEGSWGIWMQGFT